MSIDRPKVIHAMTETFHAGPGLGRLSDVTIIHGDCIEALTELAADSIDAIVTDPPYGLEFMGKEWDGANGFRRTLNANDVGRDNAFGRTSRTSPEYRAGHLFQQWCELWTTEALRVLKPGGHLLAFGGTRTWHRLAVAVEDAGFEIRDSIAWLYGSGFPKSLDVSKAIDKAAGAKREVIGQRPTYPDGTRGGLPKPQHDRQATGLGSGFVNPGGLTSVTAPATPGAAQWSGWGTALKPAFEPVVVARKPLVGTVAANVLAHGTGALNIDGCRIAGEAPSRRADTSARTTGVYLHDGAAGAESRADILVRQRTDYDGSGGRWPANVVLDADQAAALDEQSGTSRSVKGKPRGSAAPGEGWGMTATGAEYDDQGGASRFFYVAKAPKKERPVVEARTERAASCRLCDAARADGIDPEVAFVDPTYAEHVELRHAMVEVAPVSHPTVKPLALMRWLVRLVTPPGGVVLDPFAGSGTTVEAALLEDFRVIGVEREADYLPMIQQRIARCLNS